jgi:CheY-like chemotaxis protein
MSEENSRQRVWMILEDEAVLRNALSEFLDLWGITPLPLEDGNEAMDWLNRVEAGAVDSPLPELALLDIRLPAGPQGHEIAQRLRSLPETGNMTIVMITAYRFGPEERARIEQAAAPDLFIHKPLPELGAFRDMLESALSSKNGNGSG